MSRHHNTPDSVNPFTFTRSQGDLGLNIRAQAAGMVQCLPLDELIRRGMAAIEEGRPSEAEYYGNKIEERLYRLGAF